MYARDDSAVTCRRSLVALCCAQTLMNWCNCIQMNHHLAVRSCLLLHECLCWARLRSRNSIVCVTSWHALLWRESPWYNRCRVLIVGHIKTRIHKNKNTQQTVQRGHYTSLLWQINVFQNAIEHKLQIAVLVKLTVHAAGLSNLPMFKTRHCAIQTFVLTWLPWWHH